MLIYICKVSLYLPWFLGDLATNTINPKTANDTSSISQHFNKEQFRYNYFANYICQQLQLLITVAEQLLT
jgi:hypothetical protein